MKKTLISLAIISSSLFASTSVMAGDEYKMDIKGQHAFVQFKVSHLGYSWLLGEFNDFDGRFYFDEEEPSNSNVTMTIDMSSVDSNHAERDKHLRSGDFFNVDEYPQASFESTSFSENANGTYTLTGDFTMKGITDEVTFNVVKVGEGEDPWGGYRAGFEAIGDLDLADYGMDDKLGNLPVQLYLSIEGVRQ